VVDPQAVDRAARHQIEDQGVHAVEDDRILHADGGQLVDVEESAIVDLFGRDAPVRQPVRLCREQGVERIEAPRVAAAAVEDLDRPGDVRAHCR